MLKDKLKNLFRVKPKTVAVHNSVLTMAVEGSTYSNGSQLPSLQLAIHASAQSSLDAQIHQVIDENANGVCTHALRVRRDCDAILSLGISDQSSGRASVIAQQALQIANYGRGMDINGKRIVLNLSDRRECVTTAMTLLVMAENLLKEAKKDSKLNIEGAIQAQQNYIKQVQEATLALEC